MPDREGIMSRNIATLQAMYAAFAGGDVAGILEQLDPAVEWELSRGERSLKWDRPRRGRDAVPGFLADLAHFEFRHFEPLGFPEGGDMVAVPTARSRNCGISSTRCRLPTPPPDGAPSAL